MSQVQKKAPHRKVRTGCLPCKKRRVKCDETKPKCQNCEWHSLECSYMLLEPFQQRRREPSKPSGAPPTDRPPFEYIDFAILRHWDVCTADSLAPNMSLQRAMREVVPLLAINHKFLMHALLSLSSLHMAYLQSAEAKKFELLAIKHQNLALPLFRTALADVTQSNCHALYACGHLVTKYHFARPESREKLLFSSSIEGVSDIIFLLRGAIAIYDYAHEWIHNGPLGFCLERPLDPDPDFGLNPDDAYLAKLFAFLLIDSSEDANTCCGALNTLRKLLAMAATPNQTVSTKTLAYTWPMQVSNQFVVLISEMKPEALLVLAHYSVLLKMIDHFWFMRGAALGILKQCRDNLDVALYCHIEWPMQVVGLKPSEQPRETA